MSAMQIKIALLFSHFGCYIKIADLCEGQISAAKLRRYHNGERAPWFPTIDKLCLEECEVEFVPEWLLNARSQFSYLSEKGDSIALDLHSRTMRDIIPIDTEQEETYLDERDELRVVPFKNFILGYSAYFLKDYISATKFFERASDGFRHLAPDQADISDWEIIHISLAQQMMLVSAWDARQKNGDDSAKIAEMGSKLLKQEAFEYLRHSLKIAPHWEFAFNNANLFAVSDVPLNDKVKALALAIFMNPQLSDFNSLIGGMTETISECRFLGAVAQELEAQMPPFLEAAREEVRWALAKGSPNRAQLSTRELPSVRRRFNSHFEQDEVLGRFQ